MLYGHHSLINMISLNSMVVHYNYSLTISFPIFLFSSSSYPSFQLPIFSQHWHVEWLALAPIESLDIRQYFQNSRILYLLCYNGECTILPTWFTRILQYRVYTHAMLFTNLSNLTSNADLVPIKKT